MCTRDLSLPAFSAPKTREDSWKPTRVSEVFLAQPSVVRSEGPWRPAGGGRGAPRATMGLLKGLLGARNLLLVIFVPLLLLPLPVLHPSSVSTARPLGSLRAGRRGCEGR